MNSIMNFRHSGRLGDIVYSLAFVKEYCRLHGVRACLYVMSDARVDVKRSAWHPGGEVMVSVKLFEFLKPLLLLQEYIYDMFYVDVSGLPPIFVDLDLFKNSGINLKAGMIQSWYRTAFSIPVPVEKPWLGGSSPSLDDDSFDILVNKSTRFYNEKINYSCLNNFDRVGFVGLRVEFEDFVDRHSLSNLVYVEAETAVDVLRLMRASRLFIGNQSFLFSLAEAAKIPRALDVYEPVPNVIPVGGDCIDFNGTSQLENFLEFYFKKSFLRSLDLPGDYVESVINSRGSSALGRFFKFFLARGV